MGGEGGGGEGGGDGREIYFFAYNEVHHQFAMSFKKVFTLEDGVIVGNDLQSPSEEKKSFII